MTAIDRLRDGLTATPTQAELDALAAVEALYQAAVPLEQFAPAAEMRWMSVEDAHISVPARLIAELSRARRRVEAAQ